MMRLGLPDAQTHEIYGHLEISLQANRGRGISHDDAFTGANLGHTE